MLAIETHELVKQYKNGVKALDNLNLEVNKGEIFFSSRTQWCRKIFFDQYSHNFL